jgi:pyruvate/oxaloacetate carboxyltransferase
VQNVAALKGLTDDLKTLKARVDTIDAAVKALSVQMVLKTDLSTANQLKDNERDKEGNALELRMQAEAKSQADKQKKETDLQLKEAEAQMAKIKAEIQAQIDKNQAQIEKTVNEARLATLEARLKTLEARPK